MMVGHRQPVRANGRDDAQLLSCSHGLIPTRIPRPPRAHPTHTSRTPCAPRALQVHHGHLERIWELVFRDESGHAPAFQRYSIAWCAIGFQQRDPSADVRGGGELSLDFMLYLLEQQRPLVERILRAHKRRTLQRGQYANYPFACAAIGITRKLAEVFQIVQPHLGPTDEYEVALKHFYPCVQSKQTFMELACATFSLLDHKVGVCAGGRCMRTGGGVTHRAR
mmetsp:Transcript_25804/g.60311  ORF Transcript_25804/g.60311 Transcript_25804/m.60311 type:complete len:223 (+) Transcript_25804:399-1067(+)